MNNNQSHHAAELQRISECAQRDGFELYDAGPMGLGVRTATRHFRAGEDNWAYTGVRLACEPPDSQYAAEYRSTTGETRYIDATDMRLRGWPAMVNCSKDPKIINARLIQLDDGGGDMGCLPGVYIELLYDNMPPGVPLYVDYGESFTHGLELLPPTDAWTVPASNGGCWTPPAGFVDQVLGDSSDYDSDDDLEEECYFRLQSQWIHRTASKDDLRPQATKATYLAADAEADAAYRVTLKQTGCAIEAAHRRDRVYTAYVGSYHPNVAAMPGIAESDDEDSDDDEGCAWPKRMGSPVSVSARIDGEPQPKRMRCE